MGAALRASALSAEHTVAWGLLKCVKKTSTAARFSVGAIQRRLVIRVRRDGVVAILIRLIITRLANEITVVTRIILQKCYMQPPLIRLRALSLTPLSLVRFSEVFSFWHGHSRRGSVLLTGGI